MHTQELKSIRQALPTLFADEIVDLKKDIDCEVNHKTASKDALHQINKKSPDINTRAL